MPFIIVDDASHKWSHQILTFEYTFHFLMNGGFYICEDLQTSFGRYREKGYNDYHMDAAHYFMLLALLKLGKKRMPHPLLVNVPASLLKIADYVDYIVFRNECALIKKR